jgi:anti-sigma regulatory factor (Ser/Thr protein kinase)
MDRNHAHDVGAAEIRLQMRSDPRLLGSVRSLVRCWFERHGVERTRIDDLVLAVDEACANAIRHAYDGRCDELVEVELAAAPAELRVDVCDRGATAPPEAVDRRPLPTPDVDRLCPGGLGVQLMHTAFDEVRFCPGSGCGNRVSMRLVRGGGG